MTTEESFRQELKALVLKYDVTLEVDDGDYGSPGDVHFCVGPKRVVVASPWDRWDFDAEGMKTLDELRKEAT